MARMPLVVGTDDYTRRLFWHVERVQQNKPIYFPNINARLGFVRSDFAGSALLALAKSDLSGPVNSACPGDMKLSEVMQLIEKQTGQKLILASEADSENHSPFGIESDWTMDLDKLHSAGVVLRSLNDWMPALIAVLAT